LNYTRKYIVSTSFIILCYQSLAGVMH